MTSSPVIILVRPQMGENIGAAARAMFNFGLADLRLVSPRDGWPSFEAERNSAGALERMPPVRVFETLRDAIADLHFTYATTARPRDMVKDVFTPDEAAGRAVEKLHAGQKVGFVFGGERAGLGNDDIALCQAIITIPANPDFASFNLAQAVLLVSYAYSQQAAPGGQAGRSRDRRPKADELPATQDKLEEFFMRLETELGRAGFFRSPELQPTVIRNIRAMFTRREFTQQELKTFHGILSALIRN